jgi:hypothetical protein
MWLKMASVASMWTCATTLSLDRHLGTALESGAPFWANPKLISTCTELGLQIDWSSAGLVELA